MNTIRRTCVVIVGLALLPSLTLSACSSSESKPKAKDAWNKAQEAMTKHSSFMATGTGKDASGKSLQSTVFGDTKGSAYQVDYTQGADNAKVLTVGGKEYVKASIGYYESQGQSTSSMAQKLAGKWIIDPSADDGSPIKSIVHDLQNDNNQLSKQLLSDQATVTADTVNGQDAWKLTGPNRRSLAWISKDGKYTLLKVEGMSGAKTEKNLATVTFTNYDKNFAIKAPADAKSAAEVALAP